MTTPTDPVTPKTFEEWNAQYEARWNDARWRDRVYATGGYVKKAAEEAWNASAAASKCDHCAECQSDELAASREREEKLREYARHKSGCNAFAGRWNVIDPKKQCTCGLAALLGEGEGR